MSSLSYPFPSADLQAALIELIYAGSALAARLTSDLGGFTLCVCGLFVGHATNPDHHLNTSCPVARFYRAVEELDTAVRS